jgi:hypothetical protein
MWMYRSTPYRYFKREGAGKGALRAVPTIYHRSFLVMVGTLSRCPPYGLLRIFRAAHQ